MSNKFKITPPFGLSNTQKLQGTSPGKDRNANSAKDDSAKDDPKYNISTQGGKQMIQTAGTKGVKGRAGSFSGEKAGDDYYTTGALGKEFSGSKGKAWLKNNPDGGIKDYEKFKINQNAAAGNTDFTAAVEEVKGEAPGEWKARTTKQKTVIQSKHGSNKEYRKIKSTSRKTQTNNMKSARNKYDPNNTLGPDGTSISFKQYMKAHRKHEKQRKLDTRGDHLDQKTKIQGKQSGIGNAGDIMHVEVEGSVADMTKEEIAAMNANKDSTSKEEKKVDYTRKHITALDKIKGLVKKKK